MRCGWLVWLVVMECLNPLPPQIKKYLVLKASKISQKSISIQYLLITCFSHALLQHSILPRIHDWNSMLSRPPKPSTSPELSRQESPQNPGTSSVFFLLTMNFAKNVTCQFLYIIICFHDSLDEKMEQSNMTGEIVIVIDHHCSTFWCFSNSALLIIIFSSIFIGQWNCNMDNTSALYGALLNPTSDFSTHSALALQRSNCP